MTIQSLQFIHLGGKGRKRGEGFNCKSVFLISFLSDFLTIEVPEPKKSVLCGYKGKYDFYKGILVITQF